MKKLQLLILLHCRGTSLKQISRQTGIARNTVKKYVFRFMESRLTLEDFKSLSDHEIYKLFQCTNFDKPLTDKMKELYEFFPYVEKENKKVGVSQYIYVEASYSQKKEDFIDSTQNALLFYEGVPAAIVPDNLRSAVTKSNKFEPTLNETFEDFALHYETCIIPARAYKPKDKSLAENGVKMDQSEKLWDIKNYA